MSVRYDYFNAPSDDQAAAVSRWSEGPGHQVAPSRRRWFAKSKRAAAERQAVAPSIVVATRVDPVVQCGRLEALLTERPYDEVVKDPRSGHVLASRRLGARVVLTVTDALVNALADADEPLLAEVSVAWALTDEQVRNHASADHLRVTLRELSRLAREARSLNQRVYCWASA